VIDGIQDKKIAHIHLDEVSRVRYSSVGLSVPIVDHSGLHIHIHMTIEQAHLLMVDLQMSVISWIASHGPQLVSIPKAPVTVMAHSWKIGVTEDRKDLIVRIEGDNSEIVDINIENNGAILMANEIIQFSEGGKDPSLFNQQ
jgi:hypothetical protein